GFTMALFIDSLAFEDNVGLLNTAKVAILVASLVAGVVGYLILRTAAPTSETSPVPSKPAQATIGG
ncbi:MAG: Na+/H+ antiporter NhaA, partial [Anaerolineae bacterium]|nr:Na+/H+ antiporter NhaA [Anaerolineae bacterium]